MEDKAIPFISDVDMMSLSATNAASESLPLLMAAVGIPAPARGLLH